MASFLTQLAANVADVTGSPGTPATMPTAPSLRTATRTALLKMLALDDDADPSTNSTTAPVVTAGQWKVLILDSEGRDVLTPVLNLSDLRDAGVTVHMSLGAPRQPLRDVPAVYFVSPTAANIARIIDDIAANLYEAFYLHFTSSLPRALLEQLAQSLVQRDAAHRVAKVMDQYLPFRVLEDGLFSLAVPRAFATVHAPGTSESQMELLVDQVATGLFGVCTTLGSVPVLRYARGNAAELIATRLEAKLRDAAMNPRNGLFDADAPRPVLVLLDRHADLATMVAHSWLYSALVHDVLDLKLNRIACAVDENGQTVQKTFDIDAGTDFIWRAHAGMPFPEVAEAVDVELNKYKQEAQDILSATGATSLEEMNSMDTPLNTKQLQSALTQLPALTARKRVIDTHMQVATALLSAIQARGLDVLFETEQKLTRAAVADIVKDPSRDPVDKLRLILVYDLTAHDPVAADVADWLAHVRSQAPELPYLAAADWLKSQRALLAATASASNAPAAPAPAQPARGGNAVGAQGGGDLFGRFNRLAETLQLGNAYETLVGAAASWLGRHVPTAVRHVECVLDGVPDDRLGTLDPRLPRGARGAVTNGGGAAPARSAIVVMVGGGNYLEYQQLQEVARSKKRTVVYGATEILNAKEFLQQLAELGVART
ncbi:Vesicle trafficking between the ER and Golgi [Allomyces arbusculus]|nr:Vesicle trafficking between the ER and Golgi [Allomyces arbusculus]